MRFSSEKVKVVIIEEQGQGPKKNAGVANATGEICAFVDDDAYPDRNWLKNAVKYFDDFDVVAVSGPGVTPPNDNLMQKASGLIYSLPMGAGKTSHRYAIGKETSNVDELTGYNLFIRSSFLKEIGGINVKFRSGEDSLLTYKIIECGRKFRYAPDVIVYHHRRPLFVSHLKQVSTYALHRGYFLKKYPDTSAKLSYALPSILLITIITLAFLSIFFSIISLPLIVLIAGYFVVAFLFGLRSSRSLKLSVLASIGIGLTHLVYGLFFIVGLLTKNLGERASY